MRNKIIVMLTIMVITGVSYAYNIDVYVNKVGTITLNNNQYDLYSANIYLNDDNGNRVNQNVKMEIGTYICSGNEITFYKTIDDKTRYECIDYLNTIETSSGRYYTYLMIPSGLYSEPIVENISGIYYLEGVFEDNTNKYFLLMIIFFAMLSILLAL